MDRNTAHSGVEPSLRIVIADDQAPARRALKALLETHIDWRVIGEANNGCQLLQLVNDTEPDVALIDVQMSEMDGLVATRLIKKFFPDVRTVLISVDSRYRWAANNVGADAFLIKGCPPESIIETITDHPASLRIRH